MRSTREVGGQAVLGRQSLVSTPWLTERHGYDPTLHENHFVNKIYLMTENENTQKNPYETD